MLDGDGEAVAEAQPLVDVVKTGASDGFSPKMQALLAISRTVRGDARQLTAADVQAALDCGATDADVQLAILIASGFSMYNRLVEGFRAQDAAIGRALSGARKRDRAERV